MKDVIETRGKNKASMPWFKFFPKDWIEGTRGLTPEQRGIYADCIAILYQTEQPIPLCDKRASYRLEISARLWQSVKRALLDAGKLKETPEGYVNERVLSELHSRAAQSRAKSESAASRERAKREKEKKENENKEAKAQACETSALDIRIQKKERKEPEAAALELEPARPSPSVAALPASPADLIDRLVEACNGSLDNPVNCMGLLSSATPQMWIDRGADLERDVIPTLQAAGKKYHGKRIRDWSYFTGMVADAVEKRKAELPAATQQKQPTSYSIGAKIKAYNERLKSEGAANV
jgi:uncharacterized protein YdaU (DUF1376 family)